MWLVTTYSTLVFMTVQMFRVTGSDISTLKLQPPYPSLLIIDLSNIYVGAIHGELRRDERPGSY